jgi:hypothetical protein
MSDYKYIRIYLISYDLQFKCCGAVRFGDWIVSEWFKGEDVQRNGNLVPDSCCKTPSFLCGKRDHPSNIQYSVSFVVRMIIFLEIFRTFVIVNCNTNVVKINFLYN